MTNETQRDDDPLVHDIRDCTPEEVRSHLLLLLYTPVCAYARAIFSGQHSLKKGLITSLARLGSAPTISRTFGK